MSAWNKPSGTVIPVKGRKRNANRVITPYVTLTDNVTAFENDLAKLRSNNGQYRAGIEHLLGSDAGDILDVVPVHRNDLSIAYLELRLAQKNPHKDVSPKTFRILYRGDVTGSDDPRHDGTGKLLAGIEPLAQNELLIPTNSRELLDSVAAYRAGQTNGLRPAFLWCEGEKARLGMQRRISTQEAVDAFAEKGLFPVTAATLTGMHGAQYTNYALMPQSRMASRFVMSGKNDIALDLSVPVHIIVPDNDNDGYSEACMVAERLITAYIVPDSSVRVAECPASARKGWDDADPLPAFMAEIDRINQLLAATPYTERWVYKSKRNSMEIDPTHMHNRRRALKLAGVEESYIDTSTNQIFIKSSARWQMAHAPDDTELMLLAEDALDKMGHPPVTSLLQTNQWRETLNSMYAGKWRDSIYDETMATIQAGEPLRSESNLPQRLFIEMFGLPDVPYIQMAGWHLIRDMLALRLRPALNAQPLIPQLLFVFFGDEGSGKSTAVKVLGGGSPRSLQDTLRYTDKLDFGDIKGSNTHGDLQLYHKIAGMTAVELADKSLGVDINRSRADMLKHFANKGEMQFRRMFGSSISHCNIRCVRIFTTNNPDILTPDMGSRRWVIVDASQTLWPNADRVRQILAEENREPNHFERARLLEHNPGLDWVYDNLPAMLAHMYHNDAWQGDLQPTTEFAALLEKSQSEYMSEENWELIFTEELTRFEEAKNIGISPPQIARYVQDTFGSHAPTPQAVGALMRRRLWRSSPRRFADKVIRLWHHCLKPSAIDKYAIWVFRDGSSPGRWVIQNQPNEQSVAAMEAATDDMPF